MLPNLLFAAPIVTDPFDGVEMLPVIDKLLNVLLPEVKSLTVAFTYC